MAEKRDGCIDGGDNTWAIQIHRTTLTVVRPQRVGLSKTMPHISVVTSLFRSGPYIEEFYERSLAALRPITDDYEFIFVDDGSPDDGKDRVLQLIERDDRVRLIEFSRNFGHHKAIMTGLQHARGDYVFMLDSDLEEEPELLAEFYRIMKEDPRRPDVVYGYMEHRKGTIFERAPGELFYKIINLISEIPIPANPLVARLMTQGYVRNLMNYRESHVFLGGVLQLTGYRQIGIPAKKLSKGRSTYTWSMKFAQAMDAILSFTNKPLTYVAGLGMLISAISAMVVVSFFLRQIMYDTPIEGWAIVLASVWFLGGLSISSVGVVGFYVGRIFLQVKQRPNSIVREIHNEYRGDEDG